MSDSLDMAMIRAHAESDGAALIALYTEAAGRAETRSAEAFFLTHAYVFALEAGCSRAATLRARLVKLGSETAA